jgi:hypothetical protein
MSVISFVAFHVSSVRGCKLCKVVFAIHTVDETIYYNLLPFPGFLFPHLPVVRLANVHYSYVM